ncbi:MAG: FAD-dependent oxidoreductase [Proteobacteria bacterium]|nr:FAD-dependent oxidoreductase [Pseudomonadota bacterium]
MALYDNLFEPIQVNGCTIPNRIVRSAHGTGLLGEDLIAYHEARARGGVGMSTLQATGVHPNSGGGFPLWDDSCIGFYEELAGRIRPHGMKLFQQIYHVGATGGLWSPSPIPNPLNGTVPFAMTKANIDEVIDCFASAARRVAAGGLDGVDIHASSGYLLHEFLSPALNQREDDYGGSFENRLRIIREVIAAVRAEVPDGFVVGIRLPNEDYVPGGLTAELNRQVAEAIEPEVDYISLHMGTYWRFHTLISPTDDPLGAEMKANNQITPNLTKPRMVTGRIMTLDHASSLVSSGEADLVSMVRALIADPELVNKARRLEEHKIRPCIGSNQGCVGQLMTVGRLSCVVNIAAGKEAHVNFEPEDAAERPKRVMVVGGGIAGMEAARTAALRGHRVVLHEATNRLGGQTRLAASAPHRGDIGTIADYLQQELESLQVEIRYNSFVDPDIVDEDGADEVIIATGATPRDDGFQVSTPAEAIPGFDLPHVYDSWSLFGVGQPPKIVGPAVVFDDTGMFEAISVADMLMKQGVHVTVVSRSETMGANMPFPPVTVEAARERVMNGDFDFIGGHYVREITKDDVDVGVLFTDRSRRIPAKTVIIVGFNQPNRALAEELEERGVKTHVIGDVAGTRDMMTAIHAAANLARAI